MVTFIVLKLISTFDISEHNRQNVVGMIMLIILALLILVNLLYALSLLILVCVSLICKKKTGNKSEIEPASKK